ncbi:MAG: tRNA lysidine(34) synthetase TilS [Clostridia bacterium]|nr:tRNA lysidine(34) synthetase TilS [Clostridia bacterium]
MNDKLPYFFEEPHTLARLDPKEPILLALSGGADSSALLHLLCQYRQQTAFPLFAAHVNHGIRADDYNNEADRDETFCRELCEKLGVKLFVARLNVPKAAKCSGQSIETEAREARYAFFKQIMAENSIRILVTAHNASDNLETQIFNLSRGCGIDGICGIPQVRTLRGLADGIAVRPILGATKDEILAYCQDRQIPYVNDSTNFEDDCTRNRLRHRVIPELRDLFNTPEKAGLRLAHSATEDSEFILSVAEQYLAEHNGEIELDSFGKLHVAVAKRVIQKAYEGLRDARLEAIHTESILAYAKSGKDGSITLPQGISAVFEKGFLSFRATASLQASNSKKEFCLPLREGINLLEDSEYMLLIEASSPPEQLSCEENVYRLYTSAYLKNVTISLLCATNRREGDKIYDGGVGKKVKKLMCDKKIDQSIRDKLPIIRLEERIVYIPFCAVADTAKADGKNFDCNIALYIKEAN